MSPLDVPPLRQSDVSYLVSAIVGALCPPAPAAQAAAANAKLTMDARANSLTFTGSRDTRNTTKLSNHLYRVAFLGECTYYYLYRILIIFQILLLQSILPFLKNLFNFLFFETFQWYLLIIQWCINNFFNNNSKYCQPTLTHSINKKTPIIAQVICMNCVYLFRSQPWRCCVLVSRASCVVSGVV